MNAVTYITLTPPQLEEVARKAALHALQQTRSGILGGLGCELR